MFSLQNISISEQSGLTRLTFDLSGDVVLAKNLIMLINSSVELLPVEAIEKPGGYRLIYDAGSLLSLSKYLRQNRLDKAQVVRLLMGICLPLSNAKTNGIYPENFSYNPDHIFVDSQSGSLKLTYFPFETGQQVNQELKSLMVKIFGELLNTSDENTEYLVQIMDCYKQASFAITSFLALLEELKGHEDKLKRKKKNKGKNKDGQGFFSRLFKQKEKPLIPETVKEEKVEPVCVALRETNGTEFLLPYGETNLNVHTVQQSIEISIVSNGMTNQAEIKSFPCVLGRSQQEANIVLEDNSVSRKHAIIDYVGGAFVIIDNNSSNGLVINGEKLLAGAIQPVIIGDVIKFGRIEVKIEKISGV